MTNPSLTLLPPNAFEENGKKIKFEHFYRNFISKNRIFKKLGMAPSLTNFQRSIIPSFIYISRRVYENAPFASLWNV